MQLRSTISGAWKQKKKSNLSSRKIIPLGMMSLTLKEKIVNQVKHQQVQKDC